MFRSQLVEIVARSNPHLSRRDVDRAFSIIFDAVIEQLADGGRVELRGFASFSVRAYQAREGRNPKTGAPVSVAAKRLLHFSPAGSWKRMPLQPEIGGAGSESNRLYRRITPKAPHHSASSPATRRFAD